MIDREMLLKELPRYKRGEQTISQLLSKINKITPSMLSSILLRYKYDDLKIHEAITEIERFMQ